MELTIASITTALSNHPPKTIQHSQLKSAAVLVPLVTESGSLHLLLTKRTDSVEHHKGQISFPGGMTDAGDQSPTATALRETKEEIGIDRSSISILGRLNDIQVPSGFIVTPVVGYIDHLPNFTLNHDEVAEILTVPLKKFFDVSLRRSEWRELHGVKRQVFFYDVWKEPVWGATAAIIKQLADMVS